MAELFSFQSRPITVHMMLINPNFRCISRKPNQRTPNGGRIRRGTNPMAAPIASCARANSLSIVILDLK